MFVYWKCPECDFDAVTDGGSYATTYCPVCAGDTGRDVAMHSRPATDDDKPEGIDARKHL